MKKRRQKIDFHYFFIIYCDFRHFVGKNIVITAARPLNPGDAIAENYGPIFTRKPLTERQRSLSSRYWFQCQCQACKQDWPGYEKGLENVTQRLRYLVLK